MKNIILIGAGNLGSRHLQALKQITYLSKIWVIDPGQDSLKIAKERYDQISNEDYNHEISFLSELPKIEEKIDLVVIATNSNVRFQILENLLENYQVKYMILEKVLFQQFDHYEKAAKLIENSNCNVWVNCPRRMFSHYNQIKEQLKEGKESGKSSQLYFNIEGSAFNLMSNAIHFVDLMAYLKSAADFTVDTSKLIPNLIESKRKGYYEINGIIDVIFKDGSIGRIHCLPDGNLPIINSITTSNKRWTIFESENRGVTWNMEGNKKWQDIKAPIEYQSSLTTKVANQLFKEGTCNLTPYNESMIIHLNMFKPIHTFLNEKIDKQFEYLPFS